MTQSTILKLAYPPTPSGRRGFALLILRALVGTAFLFHGYGKVADIPAFASEFHMPMAIASIAAYSQLAGGALLLVGLATPLAALTIAGTMSVATLTLIGRGEPFINPHGHSYEASFFYLVASLTIALLGPGAYSVDAVLQRDRIGTGLQDDPQIR
jgi:putative oxidoreductase